jgi:uncharacterized protein YbaP (TraB family)
MHDGRNRAVLAAFATATLLSCSGASAEPTIWTVNGRENTVYIYGSVHVLPQGGFAIDGKLAEAWKDAEKVCLEIDSDAVSDQEMQQVTLARAIDPDGRDLFALLGPDLDRAKAAAADAGVPLEPMAPFEPWFAGMMISIMALQQHGFDIEHGVENIIETAADTDRKPICAFETVDEQLTLFDDMPIEQQRKFLIQTIDEVSEAKSDMDKMLAAWRAGDEAAMDQLMNEDFEGYRDLAEKLVFGRNERWADQVAEMLKGTDDVLVVVGTGHLVGDRGLPSLLRKRGFKVARN